MFFTHFALHSTFGVGTEDQDIIGYQAFETETATFYWLLTPQSQKSSLEPARNDGQANCYIHYGKQQKENGCLGRGRGKGHSEAWYGRGPSPDHSPAGTKGPTTFCIVNIS